MFEVELPWHLVLPAMLLSAFLKGITGLGFSTICLALLASVADLRLAVPFVLLPSLASNAIVMVQARGFQSAVIRFRWLYVATLPGLLLGLAMLGTAAPMHLAGFLGAVLVLYAIFALTNPHFSLRAPWASRLLVPTGLLTGVINGATGSQVMPVMPYLMSLHLDRDALVQAVNISFTLGSLVMMAGLAYLGFLNSGVLLISAIGIVPVWLGITVGGWVRTRLPERVFRLSVLLMLMVLGGRLVVSAML